MDITKQKCAVSFLVCAIIEQLSLSSNFYELAETKMAQGVCHSSAV